jgi:competence protein ComEC
MLAPFDHQLTGNNGSCVLKVGNGRNSVLLTGDIEKQGERALLEHHAPLQADVLVAPHHGSKTSSSRDFIEKVNPRWVVYSAGFLNRFHFPSSPIVKRYQAQGVRQLLTADTGAIEMIHTRAGWRISLYRQDNRHLWRDSPGTKFTER